MLLTDEGMMNAAYVIREAARENHRTSDRIEEAVRQMSIIFDVDYGGAAPKLLELLQDMKTERTA